MRGAERRAWRGATSFFGRAPRAFVNFYILWFAAGCESVSKSHKRPLWKANLSIRAVKKRGFWARRGLYYESKIIAPTSPPCLYLPIPCAAATRRTQDIEPFVIGTPLPCPTMISTMSTLLPYNPTVREISEAPYERGKNQDYGLYKGDCRICAQSIFLYLFVNPILARSTCQRQPFRDLLKSSRCTFPTSFERLPIIVKSERNRDRRCSRACPGKWHRRVSRRKMPSNGVANQRKEYIADSRNGESPQRPFDLQPLPNPQKQFNHHTLFVLPRPRPVVAPVLIAGVEVYMKARRQRQGVIGHRRTP